MPTAPRRRGFGSDSRTTRIKLQVEPLEERLALASDLSDGEAARVARGASTAILVGEKASVEVKSSLGVIKVGTSASGPALRILSGAYTIRPLRAEAPSSPGPVIVGAGELRNRRVLNLLKRAYEAGETVGVTRANPTAVEVLGRALGTPELAIPTKFRGRTDLITFRDVRQDGRHIFSSSVLLPRGTAPAGPAVLRAGHQAADRFTLDSLVKVFSAPPVIPTATACLEPSLDLIQMADERRKGDGGERH